MGRVQRLQKKNWRLPLKNQAKAAATAVVRDGRAATSLPVAGGEDCLAGHAASQFAACPSLIVKLIQVPQQRRKQRVW